MSTHHTVRLDMLKEKLDRLFASYWERETAGSPASPETVELFREVAEHAYQSGFSEGIKEGVEHGAKLAAAQIASDVHDILDNGNG